MSNMAVNDSVTFFGENLHPIDLAVVVAYVALITYVGIRFAQRVKTAKDFFSPVDL